MKFHDLSKKIVRWQIKHYLPKPSELPNEIFLSDEIINAIDQVKKYTKIEVPTFGTQEHTLSWKHSSTVFYVGGQLIATKPTSDNYSSVYPTINITKIDQEISKDKKKVKFLLEIADSIYMTKEFPIEQWLKDGNGDKDIAPIFVIHSHARNYKGQNNFVHTFFSQPEITVLQNLNIYMLGLLMDEVLWIAFKTHDLQNFSFENLSKVTLEEAFAVDQSLNKNHSILFAIDEYLKDCGLVFYYGRFRSGKLKKVKIDNFKNEIRDYIDQKKQKSIKLVEAKYMSNQEQPNPKTIEQISATYDHNENSDQRQSIIYQTHNNIYKIKKNNLKKELISFLLMASIMITVGIVAIFLILTV
jgi:hypothetical protein